MTPFSCLLLYLLSIFDMTCVSCSECIAISPFSGESPSGLLKDSPAETLYQESMTRQGKITMSHRQVDEYYIELTVDVLKSRNFALVKSLKDFLTVLPNPSLIEVVLTQGVYRLIDYVPETADWILQNPDYLMPELDLYWLALSLVRQRLKDQGFIQGKHFWLHPNHQVLLTPEAEIQLLNSLSSGEKLLVFELLTIATQIDPS
ncbi:hypothetical protein K4A83_10800 [Spirulina subsalsa FACHB-351]|uniref:Uncharacterized protein n=1 Tax=Spirulina subsalsa FACHB-351 TaxID=234711 RepID=A0ABT3L5G3_9CYAN|nr:hypothetical protein [Spirulina subsalsa]MCW6036746.1 hypothetical protein [Spirulina subsalsa FACHB-351]